MEFVDDLADSNRDKRSSLASNAVLEPIQREKHVNCLKLIPRMIHAWMLMVGA